MLTMLSAMIIGYLGEYHGRYCCVYRFKVEFKTFAKDFDVADYVVMTEQPSFGRTSLKKFGLMLKDSLRMIVEDDLHGNAMSALLAQGDTEFDFDITFLAEDGEAVSKWVITGAEITELAATDLNHNKSKDMGLGLVIEYANATYLNYNDLKSNPS